MQTMTTDIESEITSIVSFGCLQVTLKEYDTALRRIGYKLDPSMACHGVARVMTGPRAGSSYPSTSLSAIQIDDGKSYAHYQARRDDAYETFKVLRSTLFAVVAGRVATL